MSKYKKRIKVANTEDMATHKKICKVVKRNKKSEPVKAYSDSGRPLTAVEIVDRERALEALRDTNYTRPAPSLITRIKNWFKKIWQN